MINNIVIGNNAEIDIVYLLKEVSSKLEKSREKALTFFKKKSQEKDFIAFLTLKIVKEIDINKLIKYQSTNKALSEYYIISEMVTSSKNKEIKNYISKIEKEFEFLCHGIGIKSNFNEEEYKRFWDFITEDKNVIDRIYKRIDSKQRTESLKVIKIKNSNNNFNQKVLNKSYNINFSAEFNENAEFETEEIIKYAKLILYKKYYSKLLSIIFNSFKEQFSFINIEENKVKEMLEEFNSIYEIEEFIKSFPIRGTFQSMDDTTTFTIEIIQNIGDLTILRERLDDYLKKDIDYINGKKVFEMLTDDMREFVNKFKNFLAEKQKTNLFNSYTYFMLKNLITINLLRVLLEKYDEYKSKDIDSINKNILMELKKIRAYMYGITYLYRGKSEHNSGLDSLNKEKDFNDVEEDFDFDDVEENFNFIVNNPIKKNNLIKKLKESEEILKDVLRDIFRNNRILMLDQKVIEALDKFIEIFKENELYLFNVETKEIELITEEELECVEDDLKKIVFSFKGNTNNITYDPNNKEIINLSIENIIKFSKNRLFLVSVDNSIDTNNKNYYDGLIKIFGENYNSALYKLNNKLPYLKNLYNSIYLLLSCLYINFLVKQAEKIEQIDLFCVYSNEENFAKRYNLIKDLVVMLENFINVPVIQAGIRKSNLLNRFARTEVIKKFYLKKNDFIYANIGIDTLIDNVFIGYIYNTNHYYSKGRGGTNEKRYSLLMFNYSKKEGDIYKYNPIKVINFSDLKELQIELKKTYKDVDFNSVYLFLRKFKYLKNKDVIDLDLKRVFKKVILFKNTLYYKTKTSEITNFMYINEAEKDNKFIEIFNTIVKLESNKKFLKKSPVRFFNLYNSNDSLIDIEKALHFFYFLSKKSFKHKNDSEIYKVSVADFSNLSINFDFNFKPYANSNTHFRLDMISISNSIKKIIDSEEEF